VREIAAEYDLEAVRMFMLSAQYRSPINFSRDLIEQAKTSLERLYTARNNALFLMESAPDKPMYPEEEAFAARGREAIAHFDEAMDDDLNTADALGAIFDWARDMNATLGVGAPSKAAIQAGLDTLNEMTGVLGILTKKLDTTPEDVKSLVEARQAAKKEKRFADADRIRGEVLALGYVIEDTPAGPKVRKA
jgi:cysteinyl-tRNA synthetase